MKRSKLIRTITMVICVAALSAMFAGVAFAGGSDPAKDVLDKQQQVDKYLFEDHKDETAALGFTVTGTSPTENCVEIGITPYTEENANKLYGIFGKDMVKVVEGQQPIPYGEEIYSSGLAVDNVQTKGIPVWVFVLAGAVVAAGIIVLVLVRRKATR